MGEYTWIVKEKRIPVPYENHKAYYEEYKHERHLKNRAAKHEHSLEQCIETDVSIKFICLHSLTTVGDGVLKSERLSHLPYCWTSWVQRNSKSSAVSFFKERTKTVDPANAYIRFSNQIQEAQNSECFTSRNKRLLQVKALTLLKSLPIFISGSFYHYAGRTWTLITIFWCTKAPQFLSSVWYFLPFVVQSHL